MLKDDQVIELLKYCEELLGYSLKQIRGNLKNLEHRSAAIFELIVIDQLSRIGIVEYESKEGQSPDIKLIFDNGAYIWIEIAFLYPRYWKNEQRRIEFDHAVSNEAKRRKISPEKIQISFFHTQDTKGKPKQSIPELHQIKKAISSGTIKDFFDEVVKNPDSFFLKSSDDYNFTIQYNPDKKDCFKITSSTVMESTDNIKENNLYRVLKSKCQQHKIKDEPRLILVGTDKSSAIPSKDSPERLNEQNVINKIFTDNTSISGILLVRIEPDQIKPDNDKTHILIYKNSIARNPLENHIIESLREIDFKGWKYTSPIDKFKTNLTKKTNQTNKTSSSFKTRFDEHGPIIELAENILIDIIAGKTSLRDEFPILKSPNMKFEPLKFASSLREVSFIEADLRQGKPRIVVLKFTDDEDQTT